MSNTNTPPAGTGNIADLSFEDALQQLETIVRQLEAGDTTLDTAISAYERGSALKDHCAKTLKNAKARVEKISIQADSTAKTELF